MFLITMEAQTKVALRKRFAAQEKYSLDATLLVAQWMAMEHLPIRYDLIAVDVIPVRYPETMEKVGVRMITDNHFDRYDAEMKVAAAREAQAFAEREAR